VDQSGAFTSVQDPSTPTTGITTNQLLGVNNSNVAAGFYADSGGLDHGYLYNITGGTFTPINLPSSFGATSVVATGVNNAGIVSGFFVDGAGNLFGFLDESGTFVQLSDPNGTNTMILGLNNNGQAVGSFVDAGGVTQGLVYDWLTNTWKTVSDPSASSSPAFDVTGQWHQRRGNTGWLLFRWCERERLRRNGRVPEPSTWAMMLIGFAGLGALSLRARRKFAGSGLAS
jgi:hypothetical protein